MDADTRCPCGSPHYGECCAPLHAGAAAPTAERLMRSRFSAFALGLDEYVLASWHPSTRPRTLEPEAIEWRRLQIVDSVGGGPEDETGVVEFRASYRTTAGAGVLHERSRFVRQGVGWRYLDGELLD